MKNISFYLLFIGLIAFSLGCDKCKDKCASIDDVLPDNNPPGYEVLLKVTGLSQSAKVVFGTVEASSRLGSQPDEIIATVPDGLSGNVEISVEEGECIARFEDFVVTNTVPDNVQPSFQQIVIPVPTQFPDNDFGNEWKNAAPGSTQRVSIQGTLVNGLAQLESFSIELDNINPFFDGNPVKGNINNNTNTIYLEIDRSAKPGGFVEHFDGQFIEKPDFLPASSKPAMLLVSRETGRQLLLYFPG
jgi:hypothetical protein